MSGVWSLGDIVAKDKRHVWHPYTEMSAYVRDTDPLVVVRAEGSRLYDTDGRSYLDANSSWWVATLGHGHPRLVAALERQAHTMAHCALAGIAHPEASYLAEELCAVAPSGLSRVFYSDDGSTAVEAAIKMAVQYFGQNGQPRRHRIVALEGAFHGDTVGVASLGGVEVFRKAYAGLLFDCIHVPSPADDGAYARAFESLEQVLTRSADEIAGVVLEPLVQGSNGMQMYAPEYLAHARRLCDRHGPLLILDEVFTGYGHTGPMWASDLAGISPDIMCVAKGFSGGVLPMAATLATERVFEGFFGDKSRAFFHGHSFTGNPLGAAVAREVLRIYRDERILEGVPERAAAIAKAFECMRALPQVKRTRAMGMIGALDLDEEDDYLSPSGWRVYEAARRRGAYLRPLGNVVYIVPPLNITMADLDELLAIVEASVREVVTA